MEGFTPIIQVAERGKEGKVGERGKNTEWLEVLPNHLKGREYQSRGLQPF